MASYPMSQHNRVLQQLHSLDKTSPKFHEQLADFFRGDAYQHVFQTLQDESLASLIGYLDGVRLKIPPHHRLMLNLALASHRCYRSCRPRIPGIFASTPRDMRFQKCIAGIVYSFGIAPGMCVPGDIQRFQGAHQTCEGVPWRRPTEGQGGALLVLHFLVPSSSYIG